MRASRLPVLLLAILSLLLLGYALTIRVPVHKIGFFSDESTYHSMAYSLAHDGDLRYQKRDLERVYELGYGGGPPGLFLKREPRSGRLYYGKAFIYPLIAAPFVWMLQDNGFFVLHGLLLAAMLAAGYAYLLRATAPANAAFYTVTYLFATVSLLYYFWMTPEWFNLSVLFFATFLWLYKLPPPTWSQASMSQERGWLSLGWTDFAAAVLYGVAVYSKPPAVLLAGPIVLWTVCEGRWKRAAAIALLIALVCASLFGFTWLATGDWNYQGGDRKSFYFHYPLESPAVTFDSTGTGMITEPGNFDYFPSLSEFLRNLVYAAIGRNGGVLLYMFPAVMAVLLFLAAPRRSLLSPHGFLIAGWLIEVLGYLVLVHGNWIGGGGTVGNRYFVGFYSVLFFVIPGGAGLLGAAVSWVVAALFLAQILLNPFYSSHFPATHVKSFPFNLFPSELTIFHDLPFNTNPDARRVSLAPDDPFMVYFLDDGTFLKEGDLGGFWVKGKASAEVVLRSESRVKAL
ncbi:MAG: hypothetical protein ACE5HV_02715, partial [Acidobacteriota bacterium]